ncbi:MAG: carbamate kinase [Chloroflexota bacterium]
MRILVALGGNALLRRGEPLTPDRQRANVRAAAAVLAPLADGNALTITHGNGPQVGLLALQAEEAARSAGRPSVPLDLLGAESEGMIGYLLEQELGNRLPADRRIATLLTQVEVDADDPAFRTPTKPIGPVYAPAEGARLAAEHGWTLAPDGTGVRRVVASPAPRRIVGVEVVRILLEHDVVVICAGGGGIPTVRTADPGSPGGDGVLAGIEAVVDKDRASALLAAALDAELLVLLTDVPAVLDGFGTPAARPIVRATPDALGARAFPAGSMGPKVEAAAAFVRATGREAAIGALEDAAAIVAGRAGTRVTTRARGVELGG